MGFADEGDIERRAEQGGKVAHRRDPRLRGLGIEQKCK